MNHLYQQALVCQRHLFLNFGNKNKTFSGACGVRAQRATGRRRRSVAPNLFRRLPPADRGAERRAMAAQPGPDPRARSAASEHGEDQPISRSEHHGMTVVGRGKVLAWGDSVVPREPADHGKGDYGTPGNSPSKAIQNGPEPVALRPSHRASYSSDFVG